MFTLTPSIYQLPSAPLPSNSVPTDTLTEQAETESLISDLFSRLPLPTSAVDSTTTLRKGEHTQFLASTFFKLPGKFVSLDASRPWLVFWTVHSLDILGVALDQGTKDRVVSTVLRFLSPNGGFGGGPANSQLPHLLPTYASVCSLAITGGPSDNGGWKQLAEARQEIYDFFMSCKRPDGGFVVCKDGEVDVRGTYCLLVVATLLDLLTPELLYNVDHFLAACQTYEGGFACSAFPFTLPSSESPGASENLFTRASMAEAHGGYTSCSLNSYFLLTAIPIPNFPAPIDAGAALRWSVLQQGEAIEGGGFRGRTNKLVDGCYSWWVGGGIPVCEELVRRERERRRKESGKTGSKIEIIESENEAEEEEWEDVSVPPLFNRVALQEFTLIAAQQEAGSTGGLRDKPGKRPDGYHTCNTLSGLSIAQHSVHHSTQQIAQNRKSFDPSRGLTAIKPKSESGGWRSEEERQNVRGEVWANVLGWIEEEGGELIVGGKENRVNTTTPVFNILGLRLKPFVNYFYCQE
ncbi:protein farnesyltransferase subunit beta [Kwoniella heveanensis BCC8398]|uniref:Protein farnesyltransferase subunit beta n=1 Tax=Kwoniella heveanensis BCC8398 TaxID=1296120 RepID=A0A1B9GX09_9TREE|nr:protein farnesyltransferase subunit beta [Kwoniella heveanensis BCC8398]